MFYIQFSTELFWFPGPFYFISNLTYYQKLTQFSKIFFMKSRRNFLKQGALASAAMVVLKPFESIASVTSSFTGVNNSQNKLVFLHTANLDSYDDQKVIRYIKNIKNKKKNTILLKAEQGKAAETYSLTYDACINDVNGSSSITGDYKIIKKGGLKTGIVYASPGESNVVSKIKDLSTFLKKEKNCALVVCLSGLGYRNNHTTDDLTLAKSSTDIDMIIGGHKENFSNHPFIALNSNNAEVIIHAASRDTFTCGEIEINFDARGGKRGINFRSYS